METVFNYFFAIVCFIIGITLIEFLPFGGLIGGESVWGSNKLVDLIGENKKLKHLVLMILILLALALQIVTDFEFFKYLF